jgi:TolA-binding protein
MIRRLCVPVLLLCPVFAAAASKEIVELQRDVALLQEQLRTLQRAQDEKLAAITELMRQTLDAANKTNTAVAVLENNFRQNLRDQEKNVVAPVVGVGAKMDQVSGELHAMQQAISDVTTMMGKLQAQLTDLNNAVKVLQAPPAPPPSPTGAGAPAAAPPMPAEQLYNNALRDRSGGKVDLALQEFGDYLKWYGETDLAPNAQFYIADIHLSQGDMESALKEFDMVLERFPDNNKTADALYMKGVTLVKMGRRTQGAEEFRELMKRFPTNDLAKKACAQLTAMGFKCAAPPPRTAPKSTARKKR